MTRIVLGAFFLAACAPPGDSAPAAGAADPPLDARQTAMEAAMSAAPAALAMSATILDWPAGDGMEMTELRAGTNGWVCMPPSPNANNLPGADPMCLDAAWQQWFEAFVTRGPVPALPGVGIGYMFQGDRGASNIDPFAEGPTADNEWVEGFPHIMLVSSDPKAFESYPTDPAQGGPFVMWKGTPYAHVMVPIR